MSERALYYPYIHIRDLNWLKATLLLFSQVRRMVPGLNTLWDDLGVMEFASDFNGRECLLGTAAVWEERPVRQQEALAKKLERDAEDPAFVSRFGNSWALSSVSDNPFGFHVHALKLAPKLLETLGNTGLAWDPVSGGPYDSRSEYVAMHPSVGEVVMSTLAIACAQREGLDIVGDRRSGKLHAALISKDSEAIYNAWLHPSDWPEPPPPQPTGEDLFEFLLGFHCDLTRLTPASLASLDREPLKKLVARLRAMATDIPEMDPGPEQMQYFEDKAADVLREWRAERGNMAHFWREFFGQGLAEPTKGFAEKVVEKAFADGVVATTGTGVLFGGLAGAGAGLAIGILAHAGKSYVRMSTQQKRSAYRYLTLMEQTGVVFRSDLGPGNSDKGSESDEQESAAEPE